MRFALGIIGLACAFAQQLQPVPTRSIIDVLSANAEFSEIVQLLQHHELVPFINQVWNSTFLAPVNSAFIGHDKDTITRDQLLYHLVNATVYSADIVNTTVVYYTYLDDGKAPISLSKEGGVNGEVNFEEMDFLASPQRGVVHALPHLLDIPESLSKQLYLDADVSPFAALVDDESVLKNSFVLAPRTDALKTELAKRAGLNSSEPFLNYLRGSFGERDRQVIVKRHISDHIPAGKKLPITLKTLDGTKLTLFANSTLAVDGTQVGFTTIRVARNGIYLELTGLLANSDDPIVTMTAEKLIFGMEGYDFVKALTLYDLRDLISQSHPPDEARSVIVPTSNIGSPRADAITPHTLASPRNMLLYHFIESELPEIRGAALLETKMKLRSGKYPQRVHLERSKYGTSLLNWELLGPESYKWGNTTFYSCEELLGAPPSLLMALGPLLVSSYSITFLDELDLLQLPLDRSWTLFLPTRDAWERNALLRRYVDKNEHALARVFDNLLFEQPIYSDSGEVEARQYEGKLTLVNWSEDRREIMIKNEELDAHLNVDVSDALFDNGVAHIVDDVPLPKDLEVTAEDLIRAGRRSFFIHLLEAAGMADVLDPSSNFTVLVPPTNQLVKHNYTRETNVKRLQEMLKLHLIPDVSLLTFFDGELTTTLSGEELEIKALDSNEKFFGLSPVSANNGQRVLILEYGYTNGIVASGSGVIFLDQFISPEWIEPLKFGLRKGTYAVMGIILGIVIALALIFGMLAFCARPSEQLELIDEAPQYRDEEGQGDAPSQPIETPAVSEERAHGRHLNLPS